MQFQFSQNWIKWKQKKQNRAKFAPQMHLDFCLK